MAKALGIGGVFFKSPDTDALLDWYEKHLGLPRDIPDGTSGRRTRR